MSSQQDETAPTVDEWIAEMEMPFKGRSKKARPTQRELDLEAEGFAALYAQVTAS